MFVHVTTSTEQGSRIKGRAGPTSFDVLVRDETECPESGSMVRTLIPHVLPMTVDCRHACCMVIRSLNWAWSNSC